MEFGAALTNDDIARFHSLVAVYFHAKSFGYRITAVGGGATGFFGCHIGYSLLFTLFMIQYNERIGFCQTKTRIKRYTGSKAMKEKFIEALDKVKSAWRKHEHELTLFAGIFLVGVIGFEVGLVEGQSMQSKPLVIETPDKPEVARMTGRQSVQSENTETVDISSTEKNREISAIDRKCAFVGSKNSNKYHLPTCSFAKRIKPENRVCFISEDDAKAKGYMAGCVK